MADQFPGVDFSQWQTWESYRTPDGREYKIIPGPTNGAYVLDVVESHRTGRPFARPNPRPVYEAAEKQKKQQEKDNSLTAQLAAPAGMIAGLYGANKLAGMELPGIGDLFGGGEAVAATDPSAAAFLDAATPVATASNGAGVLTAGGEVAAVEPGLLSGIGAAPAYIPAAVIAGTALGGKAAYDMLRGKKPGLPGRIILGMATGGLSEIAGGLFGHKSTRDYAKDRTSELLKAAGDDQNAINYVQGMREQYNSAPPDPSKPFFNGKYGSFDEYQAGGLDARDLSGVYGNINGYGAKEWAALTQDQREQVTQKNIDLGNYISSKGDVLHKDKKLAQAAWDAVIKPQPQPKGAAPLNLPGTITKGPLLIVDQSAADAKKKEILSRVASR